MAIAYINPAVLRWAMDRSGVGRAELSSAFKKTPDTIATWLDGSSAPTFKQAQLLARRLRVPFGYLFLARPPADELPLPDFRRVHGAMKQKPSVDMRDAISDVLRKQDWYLEHRLEGDEDPFPFVGRFSLRSPIPVVAADIASSLSFEADVRPQSQASEFLRAFVRQVEGLGILVMRNGIVRQATNRALDVEEFRGFSIADPMAPVIFINNADSNAAQVFTLAHELAHIWIGRSGISDADLTIVVEEPDDVETFSNEVAGEILLPWSRLKRRWESRTERAEQWIEMVSREFHVSTVMVARQLWSHEAISQDEFFEFYESERAKWVTKAYSATGGNYYLSAPIRNSRLLTEAVLESVSASETSIRDASRLLGVKPANLPKLRDSMGVA